MERKKFYNILQDLMKNGYNEEKAIELFLEYEKILRKNMKNRISEILDEYVLDLMTGCEPSFNIANFENITKEELTTKKSFGVLYEYKRYLLDEIGHLIKKGKLKEIFNTGDYCIPSEIIPSFKEIINENNSDLCLIHYRNEPLFISLSEYKELLGSKLNNNTKKLSV